MSEVGDDMASNMLNCYLLLHYFITYTNKDLRYTSTLGHKCITIEKQTHLSLNQLTIGSHSFDCNATRSSGSVARKLWDKRLVKGDSHKYFSCVHDRKLGEVKQSKTRHSKLLEIIFKSPAVIFFRQLSNMS